MCKLNFTTNLRIAPYQNIKDREKKGKCEKVIMIIYLGYGGANIKYCCFLEVSNENGEIFNSTHLTDTGIVANGMFSTCSNRQLRKKSSQFLSTLQISKSLCQQRLHSCHTQKVVF